MADPFQPTPKLTPPDYRRDVDGEQRTDPHFVVDAAYLKRKLAQAEAAQREAEKKLKASGWIRTATAVLVLLGGIGTGFMVLLNEARAQAKQEVAAVDAGQQGLKARVATLESGAIRTETKLDLLLDAARVPEWKRPPPAPPLDGGQ